MEHKKPEATRLWLLAFVSSKRAANLSELDLRRD